MSTDIKYEYDFDPYGDNPHNLIKNEIHTITAANGKEFNFIVPRKGLFHRRSMRVFNTITNKELFYGRDFYFGFRLDQIIISGAQQPVYGAIVFNDRRLAATVNLQYQCLGGEFTYNEQQIKEIAANKLIDPRLSRWDAIADVPDEFPPIPHRQHSGDFIVMDDVVDAIDRLTLQSKENLGKMHSMLMEHINDHNNPHRITLADLGLDELGMLQLATLEEAQGGVENVKYMSSLRVRQSTQAYVDPIINAHKNDQTNPHKVTKDQVGLGNVNNWGIASTIQAQVGRVNEAYMTPLRTREAIEAIAPEVFEPHLNDKNNPHGVTKAQVGLSEVPNYPAATEYEAIEGSRNDRIMTPYLVRLLVGSGGMEGVGAHLLDTNNPHKVTKGQVGLGNVENYAIATLEEAVTGTRNDRYLTPYLMNQFYEKKIKVYVDDKTKDNAESNDLIKSHVANKNNPHSTTKAHVGLSNVPNWGEYDRLNAVNRDYSSDDTFITPAGTKIIYDSLNATQNIINDITDINTAFPAGALVDVCTKITAGRTIEVKRNRVTASSNRSTDDVIYYQDDDISETSYNISKVTSNQIGIIIAEDDLYLYGLVVDVSNLRLIRIELEEQWDNHLIPRATTILESMPITQKDVNVLSTKGKPGSMEFYFNGTKIPTTISIEDKDPCAGFYFQKGASGWIEPTSVKSFEAKIIEANTGKLWTYLDGKYEIKNHTYWDDEEVRYPFNMELYSWVNGQSYLVLDNYALAQKNKSKELTIENFLDSDEITVKYDATKNAYSFHLTGKVRKLLDVDDDIQFEYKA